MGTALRAQDLLRDPWVLGSTVILAQCSITSKKRQSDKRIEVEHRGIEPLTFALRTQRSTN